MCTSVQLHLMLNHLKHDQKIYNYLGNLCCNSANQSCNRLVQFSIYNVVQVSYMCTQIYQWCSSSSSLVSVCPSSGFRSKQLLSFRSVSFHLPYISGTPSSIVCLFVHANPANTILFSSSENLSPTQSLLFLEKSTLLTLL